jgi:predicted RNase H-like nuclease (RuvC/YqgF family)
MNIDFENVILPAIVSSISGIFGWVIGRKRESVEVQGSEITNTQEAIKIWREMAQEMSDKVKELSDKVDALTQEVHSLRTENTDLKHKLGLDENHKSKRTRIKSD